MPLSNTTTTVITTTSVNQGFQLQVDPQSNTQVVGNFVTDVSIQPYIATQVVSFFAQNLRPSHPVHIFFDSVNVDQYCAPGIKISDDTSTYTSIARAGNWGDVIYTNPNGTVAGQFSIPANTFKTGDRVLEITDVTSLAQGNDAMTTMASATFTASNLSVSKQIVTLTTVTPQLNYIPVTNTIITVNTFTNVTVTPDVYNITDYYWEPIAQGLTINTPDNSAGVFATSLDLFFEQKSFVNNGILVYICEINNGYPDGSTILPFSYKHLDWANVNVSTDASVSTRFVFDSPVFLNNNKEYAFIVKPDANDPDYWVYSANLGDTDITTGVQVCSQPVVGTAFYGSSVQEWSALQTEYIKFNLNIAQFTQSSGDGYFNNADEEFLTVYNIGYPNTSQSILTGDIVFQATNSYANSTNTTVNTSVYGIVDYFDPVRQIIYVANSTGNFTGNSFVQIHRFPKPYTNVTSGVTVTDYANGGQSVTFSYQTSNSGTYIAYANTYILYNPRVDAILPEFATIAPPGTSLTFDYKGVSNTYNPDSNSNILTLGYETNLFDQERIVSSKSNEVASYGSQKTMNIHSKLTSDSVYVSPVIDTVKADALVIRNLIDPIDSVYEEFFNNGSSRSKYVSQIITLADGQDSEDLQIVITGYRPPSSDIQVWVKFLNGQDNDPMSNKTWTPMRNLNSTLYCDPSNPTDFKDFTYSTPYSFPLIPTTGTITATSGCTAIVGTGTLFGNGSYANAEVFTGWYINMKANTTYNETSRRIVSITDNTHLTLDSGFGTNYTNAPYYIVPPPTTAWQSQNTVIQTTGTVTTSTTNNAIIGSGTNFATLFYPGAIINTANDSQQVVSVANNTYLTVGTPWSLGISGANAYYMSSAGLTYLNSTGTLYSTFKKFQIKVILQSNDASKVPILDSLRGLALQL